MNDSEAFKKWIAWARVNTMMFTQTSTDNGRSWQYQYYNPEVVAHEAWIAAMDHAKKTMCNKN